MAAVVVWATHFHDLHVCMDQVDHRQETLVIQRVGQQALGRVIGGDQQENVARKQRLEQAGDEHGIADVVHMKLVEAQQAAIGE
ncbi:hypothetical protein D3C76_1094410 [compost metagenome]